MLVHGYNLGHPSSPSLMFPSTLLEKFTDDAIAKISNISLYLTKNYVT